MSLAHSDKQTQGVQSERRGEPCAGNPQARFDEGPLARALRTAGWGLLNSWAAARQRYRRLLHDAAQAGIRRDRGSGAPAPAPWVRFPRARGQNKALNAR